MVIEARALLRYTNEPLNERMSDEAERHGSDAYVTPSFDMLQGHDTRHIEPYATTQGMT